MKTQPLIPLLVVSSLMFGACGTIEHVGLKPGGGGGSNGNGGSDIVVSSTPEPRGEVPRVDGRAQRVRSRPGMADVRPVGWDQARKTSSGTSLRVTYWSGVEPCNVLDHVDVAYDEKAITVTLFEGHDPSAQDVACIEIALRKAVTVNLEEPVAGREIVDGAK